MSLSSSMLVPLAGIVSAPILAHAVGAAGRGEVAAAMAPNALLVAVATLGLPEALTFHLAKHPDRARTALAWSALVTGGLGVACLAVTVLLAQTLAGGDADLKFLIILSTAIGILSLGVNLLRAAAAGRQMWRLIAVEKVSGSILRIVTLVVLWLGGNLTVLTAVLTMTICPLVSGLVYVVTLERRTSSEAEVVTPHIMRTLLGYGSRAWVGAVAGIVLAKLGNVLFTPLSNVDQLGLYVVGITIADVPVIMAVALKDALFGVSSRERDIEQFASAVRIGFAGAVLGTAVLGVTLPLWIGPVFGSAFVSAVPVTWLLMLCALANIPSFLLAAGLGAWGRPGLRSAVIAITVVVDVVSFLLLVPTHGAIGAALANLISSSLGSVLTILIARRVLAVSTSSLLVLKGRDVERLRELGRSAARVALRRKVAKVDHVE
jgi:O-antigen/teichoic acid export membrane protein